MPYTLMKGLAWVLLAVLLSPTDAALGQAVVKSEGVPIEIRQSISVESGLNDGIVLPAVLILLLLGTARLSGFGFARPGLPNPGQNGDSLGHCHTCPAAVPGRASVAIQAEQIESTETPRKK